MSKYRFLEDLVLRYRLGLIVGTHMMVFAFSLWFAFMLRLEFQLDGYSELLAKTLPIFVGIKVFSFATFRQFSGWWRYVSVRDLLAMVRASVLSLFIATAVIFIAGFREFPRSVLVLDLFVTMLTLASIRVSIRTFRERFAPQLTKPEDVERTLIVGTSSAAEMLIREVRRNPAIAIDVVGIISEDQRHIGTRLDATPILGAIDDIPTVCREHEIGQVIIALEDGSGETIRDIVTVCTSADVKHRVLPPTTDLLQGKVSISRIREVSLQDLLGRPPVRLQMDELARMISGNVVLVTGAGGSIGSELCRQVASFGPGRLVMVEQAENPLFHLERELRQTHPEIKLVPVIADICDFERLRDVMARFRPKFVLHAAAHKHVPLMEKNPGEAIKNNIIGTFNVLRASDHAKVDTCVMISTDKAVNPTSVMGASKRVAEMLTQSMADQSETRFAAVRFGNVLGSNGSVIPIFQEQIRRGGPVTVTHPKMQRYFMTIPEASRLVLQAATFAQAGEIFVLDMGEPVFIVDVARDLIRLSGLVPDKDVEIVFTGVRPGEKLYEELSMTQEETELTEHKQIFRCTNPAPCLDTVKLGARRLESLAQTSATPQEIRESLFNMLEALERREPLEDLRKLAEKVIAFPDRTASNE